MISNGNVFAYLFKGDGLKARVEAIKAQGVFVIKKLKVNSYIECWLSSN